MITPSITGLWATGLAAAMNGKDDRPVRREDLRDPLKPLT